MTTKKAAAWATQVDNEENGGDSTLAPLPAAFAVPETLYPSLADAVKVVETKAEKKKKQAKNKMSLADFNNLGSGPVGGSSGKFTVGAARARASQKEQEVKLESLPRGPRLDRPVEEAGPGLGGAFRDYGGDRGGARGGFGDRDRDERPERRGGFGDRDRDDRSQASDDGPSRADTVDDWGATRKFTPSTASDRGGGYSDRGGFSDREPRRGGFGDRDRDPDKEEDLGPSRADTSDNWGKNRAPLPPAEPSRGGAFGERRSGFGDREGGYRERESDSFPGARADEASTWGRRDSPSGGAATPGGGGDSWGAPRRADTSTPSSGGERKRLQLAPRTKPPPVIKVEEPPPPPPETPPAAAAEQEEEEEAPKPRAPRSNPFGAARPREEVLAAQSKSPDADGDKSAPSAEAAAEPKSAEGDSVEEVRQEVASATLSEDVKE